MKHRVFAASFAAVAVAGALSFPLIKAAQKPAPIRALAPSSAAASDGVQRQTAQPWTGDASAFDTAGRDELLQIPQVFSDLKIGKGSRVADVGAGGGWLTVRLANRVGPRGVVYAGEILPRYLDYIRARAKNAGLTNIQTVLGTPDDPKLPAKTLNGAIVLNAYHEFAEPLAMLGHIRAAMKPGARLGIIERDNDELRLEARAAYAKTGRIVRRVDEKNDGNSLTDDHRLALDIVRREGEKAGFKFVSSRELGEDNYLAVFEAR